MELLVLAAAAAREGVLASELRCVAHSGAGRRCCALGRPCWILSIASPPAYFALQIAKVAAALPAQDFASALERNLQLAVEAGATDA